MSSRPAIVPEALGDPAPVARLHDVGLRYRKTVALDEVTLDIPSSAWWG
jgi:hypothetical protein